MSARLSVNDESNASSRLLGAFRTVSPVGRSLADSLQSFRSDLSSATAWKQSKWRHTLGIVLLLATVFLWTASNFLASTIFADNTYSKPYFVTYTNSAFFIIPLVPIVFQKLRNNPDEFLEVKDWLQSIGRGKYERLRTSDGEETDAFLKPDRAEDGHDVSGTASPSQTAQMGHRVELQDSQLLGPGRRSGQQTEKLGLVDTAKLSFEFCFLWFVANYFTAACLEYTTVASATILTSTSSIWTLLCGTLVGVERFTVKKLVGVLASLAGIVLISTVDISGKTDENRGSFPHKSPREIAVGDVLAFLSAVTYGVYSVVMKKRIGDEHRVNMPLFFGLVGLLNSLLLWPGIVALHVAAIEPFELPPRGRVLAIVLTNSASSMVSDFCWAYSMLLTSPLVTTVGLSLTIPLSLVGQMVLDNQYSSPAYWLGAAIVLCSFIFVNHEEVKDGEEGDAVPREDAVEDGILADDVRAAVGAG